MINVIVSQNQNKNIFKSLKEITIYSIKFEQKLNLAIKKMIVEK